MHKFPLFRIFFNNKSSLILGTNHFCPLYNINDNVKKLILNKKNIITENNTCTFKAKESLDKSGLLQNFSENNYLNIKINTECHIRKNLFDLNIVKFINCKNLNAILSKINNENLKYTNTYYKINDFNINFISEIIIRAFYENGIDIKLANYYSSNKIKPYYLDDINSEEYIRSSTNVKYIMKKEIKKLIGIYLLFNKHMGFENYLEEISKCMWEDYLKYDFDKLKKDSSYGVLDDTYLLGKRNDIWIPKIINCHNSLDDPIFVFGYGHLCGKYDLFGKLKNKINNFDLEIYDVFQNKFVHYNNNNY